MSNFPPRLEWLILLLIIAIAWSLPALAEPMEIIPKDLSAAQYELLGEEYKAKGWTEDARDALGRAIKADPKGVGKKAQIYLRAYIPRYPISQAAVQENIQAFNQAGRGDAHGKQDYCLFCGRHPPGLSRH